jgi:hypothetical protein
MVTEIITILATFAVFCMGGLVFSRYYFVSGMMTVRRLQYMGDKLVVQLVINERADD